jgi:hypothetical protein
MRGGSSDRGLAWVRYVVHLLAAGCRPVPSLLTSSHLRTRRLCWKHHFHCHGALPYSDAMDAVCVDGGQGIFEFRPDTAFGQRLPMPLLRRAAG